MKISNIMFPGQFCLVILGEKRWDFNQVSNKGQRKAFLNELKWKPSKETLKQVLCTENPTLQTVLCCKDILYPSGPMRHRGCKFYASILYSQGDPLLPLMY